jgi:hypothetical protein
MCVSHGRIGFAAMFFATMLFEAILAKNPLRFRGMRPKAIGQHGT